MANYKEITTVYLGINPYKGKGGLSSGAPPANRFDPNAEGIGELYVNIELHECIELHR